MATVTDLTTGITDSHGERPLAVAVAGSLLLHACIAAGLAAVVLGDDAASFTRGTPDPEPALRALLVSASPYTAEAPPASSDREQAIQPGRVAQQPSSAPMALPPPSAVDRESPRAGGATGMSGVVEIAELRGSAPLGGDFDRRMAEEFAADPDQLVQLKPGASFGYPEGALVAGAEGHVLLWVVVGPDGSVEEKEALDGDPVFAEHVLSRIDGMIGAPAMAGGRAIRHWLALDILFAIRPDEQDAPGAASTAARAR